ncbi:hypothetical protein [Morganella morganii]|uniref:hypothetical protein n=1 Tax=Morganella morganii TaxID=582 RepID=UPI0034E58194
MRFTWSDGLLRAVPARLAQCARAIFFVGIGLYSRVLRGVWWLWCGYIAGTKKPLAGEAGAFFNIGTLKLTLVILFQFRLNLNQSLGYIFV